jgi:hypothetical protein
MKWYVKIENKPNLRIAVTYDGLTNNLIFTGEYKEKNLSWVPITRNEVKYSNETFDIISEILYNVHIKMATIVDNINYIASQFEHIKLIEVVDEDAEEEG